jgi:sulfite reductase (NADPH) hemoprotein beta-component
MPKKPFSPNFKTPVEQYCKEEQNKLASHGMRDPLSQELRDHSRPDIIWEAEQIAKSHGIYLEFNRAVTGEEKEWIYMIRVANPGGGPISPRQWLLLDDLSETYTRNPQGHTSIRLTNRQNIQFHWIPKKGVIEIVRQLAESGLFTLNGCGDNTRNVMGCPLSHHSDIFNAAAWARKIAGYFQLPLDPFLEIFAIDPQTVARPTESFAYGPNLLNRKFKIGIATVHKDPESGLIYPDNCVECLTDDMAVVPIVEKGKVAYFQIYVGGGQGERNGKPSLAALAQPLAKVPESQLLKTMDAVVKVHQEWGDRENRFWARLKYVIKKQGIAWYREKVQEKLDFKLMNPVLDHDYGDRHLHLGWQQQPDNKLWTYGLFIENGRITDHSPNGKLKTMVRELVKKYPVNLMITPNQDLLVTDVPATAKNDLVKDCESYGYGRRDGRPYSSLRLHSGACVGRDTCRLTYTDSEKFEPFLIDELEKLGWGDLKESIGITGCERQCFRPATKTIGLVGSGMDRYQFKLMGDETGRTQGRPLVSPDGESIYLRSVAREQVAIVIDTLFKYYRSHALPGEGMGTFHRRIGMPAIIEYLKKNEATAELMTKPFSADCFMEA